MAAQCHTERQREEAAAAAEGEGDSNGGLPQWVIDQTSGRSALARVASLVEAAAGGDDTDQRFWNKLVCTTR